MADVVDRETRSRMMSAIKGQDTVPEMLLRKILHARGFRFKLHVRDLPGRPDIVLPRYRAVINVHGCFWHRHRGCKYATMPATNVESWREKFESNVERDERNHLSLLSKGWRVGIVWECALKNYSANTDMFLSELTGWIIDDASEIEIPKEAINNIVA